MDITNSTTLILAGLALAALIIVVVFATIINKKSSVKNFYISNSNDINLLSSKVTDKTQKAG